MGRKFEILVIALMVVSIAGTSVGIAHQKKAVDKMRSDAVASLEKTIPVDAYRKKQQKDIEEILKKYEGKLEGIRTQEEADKLLADAKAEAAPIKTDKQLKKEEKMRAAEKAKKEAERKAAEKAAAEAAAEAARQAEQEQSYSGGSTNGSGGPSNTDEQGCVGEDAPII